MSGIMIKMGIYGILRVLTWLSPFHAWWGFLCIGLGAVSGIVGVLFAISQHDIKRLLAYHSVENIGIILLGIGISIVGTACGMPLCALFGMAGALLHVVNHALFKSLLFLGAGAVIRQTGTGRLDRLGGLIRTMPATAILFLAGSIGICGLPFFNGFISELLIYCGALSGALHPSTIGAAASSLLAALSLTLIGGLAAACFTKVFGSVFLGEPRTTFQQPGEAPRPMIGAMALLAVACLFIGLLSVLIMPGVGMTAATLCGAPAAAATTIPVALALRVTIVLGAILAAGVLLFGIMRLLRRGKVRTTVTWDCGYAKPASSMQYTASSFAAPIVGYFGRQVASKTTLTGDSGLFPRANWAFHSSVKDWYLTGIYVPVVRLLDRLFASLRWIQNGKSGLYVAYIAITLCAIIVWKFFL
jgi:hydrogenase-4 component B